MHILPAIATVSGITALIKVIGAAKVIVVARYYGVSDELDAYLVAFLIPSFAADAMAAAVTPALVPAYMAARQRDGAKIAERLTGSFLFATLACCTVLALLLAACAGPIVQLLGSGFSAAKLELTRSLTVLMAPIVIFGGMGAAWRAVLNANGEFAIPAAAFGITPAVIILFVAIATSARDGWLLAIGTAAGAALEAIAAGWCMHRREIAPWPRWHGLDRRLKEAAEQYWPMLAASLVFGASVYVHQSIAASLGAGSVSVLNYGNRMTAFLLAVGPTALGTAILPHFSDLAAREEWERLRRTYFNSLRTMALTALAVAALVFLFSDALVRVFLEHGRFSANDTDTVVMVQRYYLLQIPLGIPAAMLVRLFSSMQANRFLLVGAVISLAANTLFGVILSRSMGVAGLALASSIGALFHLGYLSMIMWRHKAPGE